MTYQVYLKILMDKLENEYGSNASKPTSLSDRRNTKETNNLIDRLTEVLRLINKAKVKANDDVDQTKLKFKITHYSNAANSTIAPVNNAAIVHMRNKSLKTRSLQRVG